MGARESIGFKKLLVKTRGEQRARGLSPSLSLCHRDALAHSLVLSRPGRRRHACLAAAGARADCRASGGLSSRMKQELWTLTTVLYSLRTRLDFSHGGRD